MSVCQTLVAESKLMAIKHLKTYIFLLNASRESWRRKLRARDTETNALVEFNNMFYMALNGMKIESTADKDRKRFEWSGREREREKSKEMHPSWYANGFEYYSLFKRSFHVFFSVTLRVFHMFVFIFWFSVTFHTNWF